MAWPLLRGLENIELRTPCNRPVLLGGLLQNCAVYQNLYFQDFLDSDDHDKDDIRT
jgi:hypothetical protein